MSCTRFGTMSPVRKRAPWSRSGAPLHLPQPDARVAAIDDEQVWIRESFSIAQNSVYIAPIGDGPGPWVIDAPYRSIAHRVVGDRLALAGARLAHVLE